MFTLERESMTLEKKWTLLLIVKLSIVMVNEWLIAMRNEMQSMPNNDVWEFVDLPKGYKPIGCKWVFKIKETIKEMLKDTRLG